MAYGLWIMAFQPNQHRHQLISTLN